MFTCPTGSILSGPNSSTCMRNGKWEPDPREVNCTDGLVTASTTMLCMSPWLTLQIVLVVTLDKIFVIVSFQQSAAIHSMYFR